MGYGIAAGGFAQGLTSGVAAGATIKSQKDNEKRQEVLDKRYEDSIARQDRLDSRNESRYQDTIARQARLDDLNQKRYDALMEQQREQMRIASERFKIEQDRATREAQLYPERANLLHTQVQRAEADMQELTRAHKVARELEQGKILVDDAYDASTGKWKPFDAEKFSRRAKEFDIQSGIISAPNGAKFHRLVPVHAGLEAYKNLPRDGKQYYVMELEMPDGSIKPLTQGRSADPNDPVQLVDEDMLKAATMDHYKQLGINLEEIARKRRAEYQKAHATKFVKVQQPSTQPGVDPTDVSVAVPANAAPGTVVDGTGIHAPGSVPAGQGAPGVKNLTATMDEVRASAKANGWSIPVAVDRLKAKGYTIVGEMTPEDKGLPASSSPPPTGGREKLQPNPSDLLPLGGGAAYSAVRRAYGLAGVGA